MTTSPAAALRDAPPRLSSYPPYRISSGEDAVDLAELAGLILDPWQRFVLQHALGERADGKWSAFEVAVILARQNGKNAILEARELAGLFVLGEELILHSAHEYRTAMEAYRRLILCLGRLGTKISDTLFEVSGIRVKAINTNGEEGLERLDNGQRVKFVARSKNAARGFSADCLIWDEAYALTEEQVDAQMPTLSARPNGQIWYTSSPPLDAVTGAQLFRVRRRALAARAGSLAYFDWGADGCLDDLSGVDLDDRDLWRATNPAYGYRITEEAIERERAAMSDAGFARERLSIWPPDLATGFRVIGETDWTAAFDPDSRIHGTRAFALAASWDRQTWSIGAAGQRRDGLIHGELVDTRSGHGWYIERARQLVQKWKSCAFVVDPVSPAGSAIPDLEAAGIEVTKVGTSDATRAFGAFVDGVAGRPYLDDDGAQVDPRDFRHIGQPELTTAVATGVKRAIGEGFAWDLKAGTSPHIVAVTNARYGFALKGHIQSVTPWVAYA